MPRRKNAPGGGDRARQAFENEKEHGRSRGLVFGADPALHEQIGHALRYDAVHW